MKKDTLILLGKDLGRVALFGWGIGLALFPSAWAAVIIGDPNGADGLSIWRPLVVAALALVLAVWLLALGSGIVRFPRAVAWRRFAVGLSIIVSLQIAMAALTTLPYVFDQTAWLLTRSDNQSWAFLPVFWALSGLLVPMGTGAGVIWLWLGRDIIPIDLTTNNRPAKPEAETQS